IGVIGCLWVIGIDGRDAGLLGVGVGIQCDRRWNQSVVYTKIFLPVFPQKAFQCCPVDGADKSFAHLLIAESGMGLVKHQRPHDIFGFFTGHASFLGLAILIVIGNTAVGAALHEQGKAGGSLFSSCFLCTGQN